MLYLRNPRKLLSSILRHIELDRQHNSMPPWRWAAFAASQDVVAALNTPFPPIDKNTPTS